MVQTYKKALEKILSCNKDWFMPNDLKELQKVSHTGMWEAGTRYGVIPAAPSAVEEMECACRIAERAGAGLVKTTTGVRTQYLEQFTEEPVGAVVEDIELMRRVLSLHMKIKASGGIYTLDYALKLMRAGADQLGVSRGDQLTQEFSERFGESVNL